MNTLLFDNDGVLVDTERYYFTANRRVLEPFGITLTAEQFADVSLRQGLSVIRTLLPDCPEHTLAGLHRQRNRLYTELLQTEPLAIPGIEKQLVLLGQQYRMAIVTSSLREHFDIIHSRLDLLRYFDFVLTREDYQNSKPAPDPYLTALQRASAHPAQCLVIEDSPRGQQSALAAGLRCVLVSNPLLGASAFDPQSRLISDIGQLSTLCQDVFGTVLASHPTG